METNINTMLAGRESRYGKFPRHAQISQELKMTVSHYMKGKCLEPDQVEALEMICHKIARVLNGDANYADNWVDIAGYATLIANRLLLNTNINGEEKKQLDNVNLM